MKNKKCSKCGEVKNIDDFENDSSKKDGHRADCRICSAVSRKISREKHKKKNAIKAMNHRLENIEKYKEKETRYYYNNRGKVSKRGKKYRIKNKDRLKIYMNDWLLKNKDYVKTKGKEYHQKNRAHILKRSKRYRKDNKEFLDVGRKKYYQNNKEKIVAYDKEYRKNNRERRSELGREYSKEKRKTNPEFKLICNLRNRTYSVLRYDGAVKSDSTLKLIGCTGVDLLKHIESKFLPGMTWDNYGRTGWHVDHEIPCASFDLTDPDKQKKCFHFSNLKPMWAIDNLKKGAKYNGIDYRGYKNVV